MAKRASLQTVADRAGVSAMTVSRMLSRPEIVDPLTRDRILAAIVETGYLARKTTRTVAVLVSSITNSTFAATVEGIKMKLSGNGYEMLLGDIGYSDDQAERVLAAILSKKPDGIIISSQQHSARNRQLMQMAGIPVVEIWDDPHDPIDCVAGISHEAAGKQVAAHFAENGYTRFAYFGNASPRDDARWTGFNKGCKGTAMFIEASTTVDGTHGFDSGGDVLDALDKASGPLAIFCSSDVLAAGVIFAATRANLSIPGDLAICGFGDIPLAGHLVPRLTSIHVPARRMGMAAAEMVLDRLTKALLEPQKRILDCELIVRETS
jgi:LacI family transcriptional regulator, gluconate utilization system Gnt-I transcriptional repressor